MDYRAERASLCACVPSAASARASGPPRARSCRGRRGVSLLAWVVRRPRLAGWPGASTRRRRGAPLPPGRRPVVANRPGDRSRLRACRRPTGAPLTRWRRASGPARRNHATHGGAHEAAGPAPPRRRLAPPRARFHADRGPQPARTRRRSERPATPAPPRRRRPRPCAAARPGRADRGRCAGEPWPSPAVRGVATVQAPVGRQAVTDVLGPLGVRQ